MDGRQGRDGSPRSPAVEVQAVLARAAAAALMVAIAIVAVALTGGVAPRLTLVGPTWQWTGFTATAPGDPAVAPDPGAYTIAFHRDRTFEAVADCARVTGTYDSIPAGRAGGATSSLTLVPGPPTGEACGPGSLAEPFLESLASARRYTIAGSTLTIELEPPLGMTFEAAPSGSAPPAASPTAGDLRDSREARALKSADAQGGPHLDHAAQVDLAPAPRAGVPGPRRRGGEPALLPG